MNKKEGESSWKSIWISLSIMAIIVIMAIGALLLSQHLLWKNESETATEPAKEPEQPKKESKVIPAATKEELLAEVNRRRAEVGVPALRYSPELEKSAQIKCDDMVARGYYDHVDPDGRRGTKIAIEDTLRLAGYYNENLLMQSVPDDSAKAVFDAWNDSVAHREEMLSSKYTMTGFGICGDLTPNSYDNPTYFVEHFYGPK